MKAARRPWPAAEVIIEGPSTTSPAANTWGMLVCSVSVSAWMVPLALMGSPNSPESGLMPAATITMSQSMLPAVPSAYLGLKRPLSSKHETQRMSSIALHRAFAHEVAHAARVAEGHALRRGLRDLLRVRGHLLQRFEAHQLHRSRRRGAGRCGPRRWRRCRRR